MKVRRVLKGIRELDNLPKSVSLENCTKVKRCFCGEITEIERGRGIDREREKKARARERERDIPK